MVYSEEKREREGSGDMRTRKIIALFLMLLMTLTGCRFVVSEEKVLTNPREESDIIVSDSNEEETKEDKEEVVDNAGQKDEQEETPDKEATNNQTKPGKPTNVAKNQEPKLSGKLEIQIFTNESAASSEAWTDVLDAFEEATGVSVTAHIGSQVNTKLSKRWLGGNPPDVALLAGSGIPDIALEESGMLYDMADLLKKGYVYGTDDKIWDVVNHDAFVRVNTKENYYRAGVIGSAYGVLYDSAYLKQLGVSAPTNYTELMKFSKTLINKGEAIFTTYGTTGNYPTWAMIMPAIAACGQKTFDNACLGKASTWQSAEVKGVLQRWYDFCNTDGVLLTGTATYDHTTAQSKWLKHDATLIGNGIWLPWEVENSTPSNFQMEFITSPLNKESQKPTVVAYPTSMIVASKAKNLENAKAFIRFLYTKKAQSILAGSYGYLPARTDLKYASISGLSPVSKRILNYMTSDKVNLVWRRYNWGDLNDTINSATHTLMTGSQGVNEVVKTIVSKTDR